MNGEDFFHHVALNPVLLLGITSRHVLSCSAVSRWKKMNRGTKYRLFKLGLISLNNGGTENEPGRFFHHVALNPKSFCCLIAQVNTRLLGSTRLQDAGKK